MRRSTVVLAAAVAAFGVLAAGAHADPAPPAIAAVGPVRVAYPSGSMHRRYFSSCSYAVTGLRHGGGCVRGVVVASYPLKRNPELGGAGASFRSDGVLFELYRAPTPQPVATRTLPPRVSLADFRAVGRGMRPTGEQRELFYRAKGANYRAIAWVGKHASKSDRDDLSGVIGSMQLVK